MRNYINDVDKKRIERQCDMMLRAGDKIQVKTIAVTLSEKHCLHDILDYIRNDLKIEEGKISGSAITDYLARQPIGYLQISNRDLYFANKYYHQYVVCKELNVDISKIERYIIHHIDEDKTNNEIDNLFIFYDKASHQAFHKIAEFNKDVDINTLNAEYIENLLCEENAESIKEYLEILHKKNTHQSLAEDNDKHFFNSL